MIQKRLSALVTLAGVVILQIGACVCEAAAKEKQAVEPSTAARLQTVQKKLSFLKSTVDKALKEWKQFEADCESDFKGPVEDLKVVLAKVPDEKEFTKAESRLGCKLPDAYKSLLKTTGPFTVGSNELELIRPRHVRMSLGNLISERVPENSLGNLKDGHYHDFMILAEYGHFAEQLADYSSGAAFNKKNPAEIIIYGCNEFWFSRDPRKRDPGPPEKKFLGYIEDCLDKLIERLKEPLESFKNEMNWYRRQE